jgi:chemotaxis protein MotB
MARRRKARHHEEEHENEERWLVSFADMMTLLMCLFMVLFSISSVNVSKLDILQKALKDAFSGKVFSGGRRVMETGAEQENSQVTNAAPVQALTPLEALNAQRRNGTQSGQGAAVKAAVKEDEDFQRLKRRIDKLVDQAHLKGHVVTQVRRRGLVVQLLTDNIFFDSGKAELKPGARGVLDGLGDVIRAERIHPVVVEGHTDSQPISGRYPSNWELSGARAASVVRVFVGDGLPERRVSLAGFAAQHPVASNATAPGRARNRRVEVVLNRIHTGAAGTRPDGQGGTQS